MKMQFSLDNINEVAKTFSGLIGDKKIIAFHGAMGAGKTTFIQSVCNVLGVKGGMSSPTFSIINEYTCAPNEKETSRIYHIDLYRLKDGEEARQAGVEDVLTSGDVCFAEWPEKAENLFPPGTVHVYIEWVDEQTRCIRIADI